jgi:hypothetical protein
MLLKNWAVLSWEGSRFPENFIAIGAFVWPVESKKKMPGNKNTHTDTNTASTFFSS